MSSLKRANPSAADTNVMTLPTTETTTKSKSTVTVTGLNLDGSATLSSATIGGVVTAITPVAILTSSTENEGLWQKALGAALFANGYIQNDDISVKFTLVDASPDTYTVTVTIVAEVAVSSLTIGGTARATTVTTVTV